MSSSSLESILKSLTMDANSFLLIFGISNFNVHNFLVDSGASVNVMPLSVTKKISAKWDKIDAQIIKLDKTLFHAVGELRDVIIYLSFDY